jgi:hypothetical protein
LLEDDTAFVDNVAGFDADAAADTVRSSLSLSLVLVVIVVISLLFLVIASSISRFIRGVAGNHTNSFGSGIVESGRLEPLFDSDGDGATDRADDEGDDMVGRRF